MSDIEYSADDKPALRKVRIVSSNPRRIRELTVLAQQCGADVSIGNRDSLMKFDNNSILSDDCRLIDFNSISERQESEMDNLSSYIKASSSNALVWTDIETLDTAFALLPAEKCHFLVEPSKAETVLLLTGAIKRGTMNQLHDNSHEGQYQDLQKISSELANVVRTLSRITGSDNGGDAKATGPDVAARSSVSDNPVSFRPALPAAMQSLVVDNELKAQQIRQVIQLRRSREKFFDASLFADPAWDILLDLLAARLEGKKVSVSSLCIAAAVPPTTALRWITSMTESGLLERHQDPNDARRVFLALADETAKKMTDYFEETAKQPKSVF